MEGDGRRARGLNPGSSPATRSGHPEEAMESSTHATRTRHFLIERLARAFVLPLAAVCFASMPAYAAEPYPSKPVKVIVPYSVGGGTDVLTRALAQRLSEATGQSFVIENRGGADATIGAAMVAKAPADGYTLLAVSGVPFLLNQS